MDTRSLEKNAKVLFQNKNWSIEKISDFEIAIVGNYSICFAYISEDYKRLVVDRKLYPKYIEQKAIKLARKHISSIYEDNEPEVEDLKEYSNGIY